MRRSWLGSTVILSCIWAVALYFNTASADEGGASQKVAALPLTSVRTSPFHEAPASCELTLNENLSPIDIPAGANLRGLSLSGQCVLTKIGGSGEGDLAGMHAEWESQYKMSEGCALLHGHTPVLIELGQTVAYVAAGTSCVAHMDKQVTRVVNLTDQHAYSIRVVFNKHYVDLAPGQELVLVPTDNLDAKAIAVQEDIGWKDIQYDFMDGVVAFVFRASSADMLDKCHIYRQLSQSADPADKRIKSQIMKTVAVLETMYNRKKGPFSDSDPYLYGHEGKPREQQATRTNRGPV